TRFVPHRLIATVERRDRGVVLRMLNGEKIELPLRPARSKIDASAADEALGLFDRIERARARDDLLATTDAHLLDPEARATKEWVASLRSPERMETFRRGDLDVGQL